MRVSAAAFLLIISLCSIVASTTAFGNSFSSHFAKKTFATRCEKVDVCVRGGTSLRSSAVEEAISSANLELLSEKGRSCLLELIAQDDGSQKHVYSDWPEPGTDDEGKRKIADQVRFPKALNNFPEKELTLSR